VNSVNTPSDSASRIFWVITCRAAWAEIPEELRLDHLVALLGDDLPGRPVDVDQDVDLLGGGPLDGHLDGLLDAPEDDVLGDVLLPVHRLDEAQDGLPLLRAEGLLVHGRFLLALLGLGRSLGHRSNPLRLDSLADPVAGGGIEPVKPIHPNPHVHPPGRGWMIG